MVHGADVVVGVFGFLQSDVAEGLVSEEVGLALVECIAFSFGGVEGKSRDVLGF